MGRSNSAKDRSEARIRKLGEVSLGLTKKIAQDEARRCPQCAQADCLPGCPLGVDIPGFIRLLREGDSAQALERIRQENPFAAICGHICPAPCEEACIFHGEGTSIPIRALERYAAESKLVKGEKPSIVPHGKRVAIIGSGPAGMSAAFYLAKTGIGVTIFEAAHEPGGLLRYAIPEFRLPQRVIDDQLALLTDLGVEIQTDIVLGRTLMVEEIFARGFSALLLATGASLPVFSDLPGNSLGGVFYDKEFLFRLHAVSKAAVGEASREQMLPGLKTVVVGRGQAAFDAARLAVRLGSRVQVLMEAFEEEAGVDQETLRESRQEGIEIIASRVLELIGDDQNFVKGVQYQAMNVVETSEGLKLELSLDAPEMIEATTVILANGQKPGELLKQYLPQLTWDADGSLWADAQTGLTRMEHVFGCGSLMTAGGSVLDAIVGGKEAAQRIKHYLGLSA